MQMGFQDARHEGIQKSVDWKNAASWESGSQLGGRTVFKILLSPGNLCSWVVETYKIQQFRENLLDDFPDHDLLNTHGTSIHEVSHGGLWIFEWVMLEW